MTGLELLREIKRKYESPQLPIVMMVTVESFECILIGEKNLKNKAAPLMVYEVLN